MSAYHIHLSQYLHYVAGRNTLRFVILYL